MKPKNNQKRIFIKEEVEKMTKSSKKKLTEEQEFEIMKLVLDKFLWLGFIVLGFGLYLSLTKTFLDGIWYLISGIILLGLFVWLIVKEYVIIK